MSKTDFVWVLMTNESVSFVAIYDHRIEIEKRSNVYFYIRLQETVKSFNINMANKHLCCLLWFLVDFVRIKTI